ncbi:MAG: leucine--tRNA ligase [Planctomycetes bacterium]|nr:leucine--tRNA ligase [Planctomycetota bacterium]
MYASPQIPAKPHTDDTPPHRYTALLAGTIETSWQTRWEAARTFTIANPGQPGFDASRPKFYCLDMFPYPSGAGLHIGHPEGYTATDIVSRYMRMNGRNVLHPMGWDAFGLPAEQYAIQTGIHPAKTTKTAIDNFRRQLSRFGFSYDWSREFGTIDASYYKWTQWIFLQLYNAWFDASANQARPISDLVTLLEQGELVITIGGDIIAAPAENAILAGGPVGTRYWHQLTQDERRDLIDSQRLAYLSETTVNWCPKLGTVLANDEVIDGKSERGGFPVYRKPLKQWMFRITAYAERLLSQLETLDWPSATKTMQREWIGKSEGAEIEFEIAGGKFGSLTVFTTRPDTLFGSTYMVVAPEHDLVRAALSGDFEIPETTLNDLKQYVQWAASRSDIERQESKDKTGVFTGVYAINPATDEKIPVWTADYVLTGYGTGAIMAVPAHDERDYEFAVKFELPIRVVVDHFFEDPPALTHILHQHYAKGKFYAAIWIMPSNPDVRTPIDEIRNRLPAGRELLSEAGHGDWGRVLLVQSPMEDAALAVLASPCRQYDLNEARVDEGHAINSSNTEVSLDGLTTDQAKQSIIGWLERRGIGRRHINYKLRDWTFSRQRYWGEPFPIVYTDDGRAFPVTASALPISLPELADYAPVESMDPMPLLAKAKDWARTTAGAAGVDPALLDPATPVTRECNTMPGSAGSSWYMLRYCDAANDSKLASDAALEYWMGKEDHPDAGVDLYLGGSEHAVGHLLYSRFWVNVLFDLGYSPVREPFRKLFHQGLITSYAYQRADKSIVPVDEVREESEGKYIEIATGKAVTPIVTKMSKRYKNVVNPDDVIAEYGADTCRLYEMYMGPLEASKPWNPRDIVGCFRFLQRVWRNMIDEKSGTSRVVDAAADKETIKLLHKTIKSVRQQLDSMGFNTAISKLIEFNNHLATLPAVPMEIARPFILLLSPFVPHIADELWHRVTGEARILLNDSFPIADDSLTIDSEIEIPVMAGGKVRARVLVPAGADAKAIESAALAHAETIKFLAGKPPKKVIVVPGKMVNLVV